MNKIIHKRINKIIAIALLFIGIIQFLVSIQLLPDFSIFQGFKSWVHSPNFLIKLILLFTFQGYLLYLGFIGLEYSENVKWGFITLSRFAIIAGILYLSHVYYAILWYLHPPDFHIVEMVYLLIIMMTLAVIIKFSFPRFPKGTL